MLKPFLLMYISITINHDLGTNLFFLHERVGCQTPSYFMLISITINQDLGTNLIFC
jgi:hypothetical protein